MEVRSVNKSLSLVIDLVCNSALAVSKHRTQCQRSREAVCISYMGRKKALHHLSFNSSESEHLK